MGTYTWPSQKRELTRDDTTSSLGFAWALLEVSSTAVES